MRGGAAAAEVEVHRITARLPPSRSRRKDGPTAAMALPVWQDLDKTHQVIIAAALGLALALVAVVRLQPSPSIWPLTPGLTNTLADRGGDEETTEAKPAIDPTEWRKFKLVEKIVISPNTAMQVVPLGISPRFPVTD